MLPVGLRSGSMDRNPQAEQMASDAMVRTLAAQFMAIWPQEAALLDRYGLVGGARVLDVGCGTGTFTIGVAERYPQVSVVGLDVHAPHLERARHLAGDLDRVRFLQGDAYGLPFSDESFELTASRHVLQCLPNPVLALKELHRVTRSGGFAHVLAEDYGLMHFHPTRLNPDHFWQNGPMTFAAAIDNDLRVGRKTGALLRQAGFAEIGVDYLTIDTFRVPREVFAEIWETWAEGYTDPVAHHTDLDLEVVRDHWADMVACIRNPDSYAVWHVPIWWARK